MFLKAYTGIGKVAYAFFWLLRVGIIPLYAWLVHIWSEPSGTGFTLFDDKGSRVRIVLLLTLPLFVALCSWLWTANYELCRSNNAAPEDRFYPIVHRVAVAFTVPACINLLTIFQWTMHEIWAVIYLGCTAAIVVLWVISLIYWIVNLILRKCRKTAPNVN